jgi:hypothetical protein
VRREGLVEPLLHAHPKLSMRQLTDSITSTAGEALFHLRFRKMPVGWHEMSNGLSDAATFPSKRQ